MNLFRKKTIQEIVATAEKTKLKRTLTVFDLVMIGIGCTVGNGVFVVTGIAAANYSGPAITLSYFLAAIVCIFTALAYAELAAMVPVSGSAYTYSYAIFGEFVAWIVGWALALEYGIGASTVATGWSGYITGVLKSGGITLPASLTTVPADGGIVDLPAILITLFIGMLVFRGTKESIAINRILVIIKVSVIFLFILIAAPMIETQNWFNDFMPFGTKGVMIGVATVFYAYIGFDVIATVAEECKNPRRDLPRGIILSSLCCAVLYISVAATLTGIISYTELNSAEPLTKALRANGSNIGSALVGTGALTGMTSVLLVLIYGQSRIFFVMSRDGLVPQIFKKMHKKYDTPYLSVIVVTLVIAAIAGFLPLKTLSHMVSLGGLFAFIIAAIGVLILRITKPELPRTFKCPAIYFTVPVVLLTCGYLIYSLLLESGLWFMLWIGCGVLVYLGYGYRNSPLNKK